MSEQQQDLLAALQAQLAQIAAKASAWTAQPALPPIAGVAVPIKVQTPIGSIRVYLSLPAEYGASPDALMTALEALAAAGYPLDTWSDKAAGWTSKKTWRR